MAVNIYQTGHDPSWDLLGARAGSAIRDSPLVNPRVFTPLAIRAQHWAGKMPHHYFKNFSIPAGSSISLEWRSRSEEHTSELQSRFELVCRLLLEKKNDDM